MQNRQDAAASHFVKTNRRISRTLLALVVLLVLSAVPSLAQITEYTNKTTFKNALGESTTIDFDALPASSILLGTEFQTSAITITQQNAHPINVFSSPPALDTCSIPWSTHPNMISSAWASTARPNHVHQGCNLYFNNASSDSFTFAFDRYVTAAGVFFSQNDLRGLTIRFLGTSGQVIHSRFFQPFAPHSGYYGITASTQIAKMEVINVAFDGDGIAYDDVVFGNVTAPQPSITSLTPASGPAGTLVTIAGQNFGTNPGTVSFGGVTAGVESWSYSSITVGVPANTAMGPVPVTVTANGATSDGAAFTVTASPDFTLSVTPAGTVSALAGTTGIQYLVAIERLNGFSFPINLSARIDPTSSITVSFNPSSLGASSTAILRVDTSILSPGGAHTILVDATGGSITHTAPVTLRVILPSVITWPAPAPIVYGTTLGPQQLNATANNAGTFHYPDSGTVLDVGTHTLRTDFTPSDSNYAPASAATLLTVIRANPSLTVNTGNLGVGGGPEGVAINPTTKLVYVTNKTSGSVSVIDGNPANPTFGAVTATVGGLGALQGVAVNPVTNRVYVTAYQDFVSIIDGDPSSPTGHRFLGKIFTTQNSSWGIAVDPATNKIYVGNEFGYDSRAVDGATLSTIKGNACGTRGVAFDPVTKRVFLANDWCGSTAVHDADPASPTYMSVLTFLHGFGGLQSVAVSPQRNLIYVTSSDADLMAVYDGATYARIAQIPVGDTPLGIAVDPASDLVFVSVAGRDVVAIVDGNPASPTFNTILGTAPTRRAPLGLAVDAETGYVYVANRGDNSVTVLGRSQITYGEPLSAARFAIASSVAGTLTYTPSPSTVLPAGTHVISVTLTPDSNNYETVTVAALLVVKPARPALTWATPAPITYGTPLGVDQLNATSDAPGHFVYDPPAGTVLNAGNRTLSASFVPDDPANYLPGSVGVALEVLKARPVITWPTPAEVIDGTVLGPAQLNATSSVPGKFVYTPPAGTILRAGTTTLSVNFDSNDPNYSSTVATVTQRVAPPLLVSLANPNGGERVFGTSFYFINWTASGGVGGPAAFDVFLSAESGANYKPISECTNLPGTARSCIWWSPGPATSKARVKVTARDNAVTQSADASDADFTISTQAPFIQISSPASGNIAIVGRPLAIRWQHNLGLGSRVQIEFSANNGWTWNVIADSFANNGTGSGSYSWLVPDSPSDSARIRVTWRDGGATSTSPAFFIASPTITIDAPEGGAEWKIGKDKQIKWSHSFPRFTSFTVQLSRDGGVTFTTLSSSIFALGSRETFTWTVTGPASAPGKARIRISATGLGVLADSPDFTIVP